MPVVAFLTAHGGLWETRAAGAFPALSLQQDFPLLPAAAVAGGAQESRAVT